MRWAAVVAVGGLSLFGACAGQPDVVATRSDTIGGAPTSSGGDPGDPTDPTAPPISAIPTSTIPPVPSTAFATIPPLTAPPAGGAERERISVPAPDGALFVDPDGEYTMTIPEAWVLGAAPGAPGAELWFVDDTVAANVNVLIQPTGTSTIDEYLRLSLDNTLGLDVVSSSISISDDGREIGLMELAGSVNGSPPLRFLSCFQVADGRAVLVTLSAGRDRFDALVAETFDNILSARPT